MTLNFIIDISNHLFIVTTPDIDKSSGFVSEQDAMLLRIGEETCQSSGATSGVKIKCPIMSNLSNVVFERRWTKDGVLIDSSDETILTTGPGIYVCTFSNICGKVNVTSVINGQYSITCIIILM